MASRDEDSFVEFVMASEQRLRGTAFLILGDSELAADVVQDALIRLYVAWPRLERTGGLPTYARRAVVSAATDLMRRPWMRERVTTLADDAATIDGDADAVTDRTALISALRRLPPRQRACLVLRYFESLSVAETAETLDCSQGTVKSQTARGLASLRHVFEGQGRDRLMYALEEGQQ